MPDDTMTPDVAIRAEGPVADIDRTYAHDKVDAARRLASGPVLYAKVDLICHADPARERPAFAKAELDVNGRMVRAHAAAATMHEAIDLLDGRLRERVEHFAHVEESAHLRHRDAPAVWHHGDLPAIRPEYFPRPLEDRELVRRKTYAAGEQTPEDAARDLAQLDHDFLLFCNVESGEDDLLVRTGHGMELVEPSPGAAAVRPESGISPSPLHPATVDVDDAIGLLDAGDEPFVFFVDATTGRGSVVYRRHDGHYGLIEPATSP